MNFGARELDEETLALWKEARSFFEEQVTKQLLDKERETGDGFMESVYLALGQRGWVAPTQPKDEGGSDLDPLRARLLQLEQVRSGMPSIIATMLPATTVRAYGSPELKAEVLPGVASGEVRICLGYTEPDCGSDLAGVRTRAIRDGDEWVVNGQKMFTTGAQFCRYAFCLTRTNPDAPKHRGLTVFLVPLDRPGVEITPIRTMGGERTNFIHFDDVRFPDRYRLGAVDDGWAVLSTPLAQEHGRGGESSGPNYSVGARRAVDELIGWWRDHDPQRLSDPQVLERLGRIEVDLAACAATPGTMGRVLSADTLNRDISDLMELAGPAAALGHGAEGALANGRIEAAWRFAPGTSTYGGTVEIHRNMIAEQLLGLPRSTPRN